jgi:hypothetical protein
VTIVFSARNCIRTPCFRVPFSATAGDRRPYADQITFALATARLQAQSPGCVNRRDAPIDEKGTTNMHDPYIANPPRSILRSYFEHDAVSVIIRVGRAAFAGHAIEVARAVQNHAQWIKSVDAGEIPENLLLIPALADGRR